MNDAMSPTATLEPEDQDVLVSLERHKYQGSKLLTDWAQSETTRMPLDGKVFGKLYSSEQKIYPLISRPAAYGPTKSLSTLISAV